MTEPPDPRLKTHRRLVLLFIVLAAACAWYTPALREPVVAEVRRTWEEIRIYAWQTNDEYCLKRLEREGVDFERVSDWTNKRGCGISFGVRAPSIRNASLGKVDPMTCRMAEMMDSWLEKSVQPAARQHLGARVKTIHHYGVFSCRSIRGRSSRMSQHAFSNAIDITGFTLTNGRRITVLRDWDDMGPEGKFLRDIARGACQAFKVTLTPEYNADHRDHFHLDAGIWRACRT